MGKILPDVEPLVEPLAPWFRELAQAGWNPITYATVDSDMVRIERYGDLLVLHNPTENAVKATVTVDMMNLGLPDTMVNTITRHLEPNATEVLKMHSISDRPGPAGKERLSGFAGQTADADSDGELVHH